MTAQSKDFSSLYTCPQHGLMDKSQSYKHGVVCHQCNSRIRPLELPAWHEFQKECRRVRDNAKMEEAISKIPHARPVAKENGVTVWTVGDTGQYAFYCRLSKREFMNGAWSKGGLVGLTVGVYDGHKLGLFEKK